jgi:hypothetical protein
MLLLVLGLIQSIRAQPATSFQSTIINTASLLTQQPSIYPIGYLPPSLINPTSNASACRKVSMFKFPASASGTPSLLKLNFPPNPNPETCTMGLSLFNFQNNSQIGYTFMSPFNTNANNTVDVSKSGWSFVRGSLYYLQIQTSTNGPSCIVRLPYATQRLSPGTGGSAVGGTVQSTYAIVVSQGPLNQPCGSSPWTSVAAINGGYIPMEIWVQQAAPATPTASPTQTPTSTGTPSPSSTDTPSPSSTDTPSPSSTDTPSPSASHTPSASITASPTPNQLFFTASQTPTLYSPSSSLTPTSSMTLSYTASPNPLNPQSNGLSSASAESPPAQNGASIAGGIIGALVLAAAAAASIVYYKNRHYVKQSRSPVTSASVIVYNPVQLQQTSESTIYAHHV